MRSFHGLCAQPPPWHPACSRALGGLGGPLTQLFISPCGHGSSLGLVLLMVVAPKPPLREIGAQLGRGSPAKSFVPAPSDSHPAFNAASFRLQHPSQGCPQGDQATKDPNGFAIMCW